MNNFSLYDIILFLHFFGLIIYCIIIKYGVRKPVTKIAIGFYIFGWFIGLNIYSFILHDINNIEFNLVLSFVNVTLYIPSFLIIDLIAWYIGKWIIKKL